MYARKNAYLAVGGKHLLLGVAGNFGGVGGDVIEDVSEEGVDYEDAALRDAVGWGGGDHTLPVSP